VPDIRFSSVMAEMPSRQSWTLFQALIMVFSSWKFCIYPFISVTYDITRLVKIRSENGFSLSTLFTINSGLNVSEMPKWSLWQYSLFSYWHSYW